MVATANEADNCGQVVAAASTSSGGLSDKNIAVVVGVVLGVVLFLVVLLLLAYVVRQRRKSASSRYAELAIQRRQSGLTPVTNFNYRSPGGVLVSPTDQAPAHANESSAATDDSPTPLRGSSAPSSGSLARSETPEV
jgi:hypothetical protein